MLIKLSKVVKGVSQNIDITGVTVKRHLLKYAKKIYGNYYIDDDTAKEVLRKEFGLTDEQIKVVLKN